MVGRCLISHKKWSKYQVTTLHLMAVPACEAEGNVKCPARTAVRKLIDQQKGGKNGQKLPERKKILANKLVFFCGFK